MRKRWAYICQCALCASEKWFCTRKKITSALVMIDKVCYTVSRNFCVANSFSECALHDIGKKFAETRTIKALLRRSYAKFGAKIKRDRRLNADLRGETSERTEICLLIIYVPLRRSYKYLWECLLCAFVIRPSHMMSDLTIASHVQRNAIVLLINIFRIHC